MKGSNLGEFEELVLLAAQSLDEDAYGVSVKRLLDRETRRDVTIGAVYSALDRLEDKGLLRSAMTPGGPGRGGRSRRSFTLTAVGRRRLVQMREIRDRLWLQASTGSRP